MGFVLFGWMARRTRKAQLLAVLVTAFSWFFLGIWYGFGFCFCTEWHWRVRERLGYTEMSDSYIEFLLEAVTPWDFNRTLVDTVTILIFLVVCVATAWVNLRDRKRRL
ncbi:MAG: DUF2784 family protein [Nitrospiraceae bacterium]|nr:DUF2784 family protein [Nitrospiraceae bacterium]